MTSQKHPQGKKGARPQAVRFVDSVWWTLCAFAGSGFLGLVLLTELRSGPILAGLGGLASYFVLAYLLPARLGRGQRAGELPVAPPHPQLEEDDPRVELLVEAHAHLATLAATRPHLPTDLALLTQTLEDDGRAILGAVSEVPDKLPAVLRFFTYYLPATADLVMDRVRLAPHAGQRRLEEIDHTLLRLVEAFAGFRAAVLQPDLQSVDLDINLLDSALDSDLEDLKTR
ncbi:MAG: hypothetical protein RL186_1341 [Pseudomonadota bacterium]